MTVKADPARTAYVRLAELAAEARHASERYRLYRARAYGPHATSTATIAASANPRKALALPTTARQRYTWVGPS